jgi:Flp pilus assembly pilin Flp
MISFPLYAALVRLLDRFDATRDERGQTTAEYALVIVAAAVIGTLVITWASKTGFVDKLFDVTIGRVLKAAG